MYRPYLNSFVSVTSENLSRFVLFTYYLIISLFSDIMKYRLITSRSSLSRNIWGQKSLVWFPIHLFICWAILAKSSLSLSFLINKMGTLIKPYLQTVRRNKYESALLPAEHSISISFGCLSLPNFQDKMCVWDIILIHRGCFHVYRTKENRYHPCSHLMSMYSICC